MHTLDTIGILRSRTVIPSRRTLKLDTARFEGSNIFADVYTIPKFNPANTIGPGIMTTIYRPTDLLLEPEYPTPQPVHSAL